MGVLSKLAVKAAKTALKDAPYFPPGSPERAANLARLAEGMHPAFLDSRGLPRAFDHGTSRSFPAFTNERQGSAFGDVEDIIFPRDGYWFSDAPSDAASFANNASRHTGGEGQNILRAHLAVKRPYIHPAQQVADEGLYGVPSQGELERLGHDGMIVPQARHAPPPPEAEEFRAAMGVKYGSIGPYHWSKPEANKYYKMLNDLPLDIRSNHYVAFDPGQIKSIFNRGTYDRLDPDMLKARGGRVSSFAVKR